MTHDPLNQKLQEVLQELGLPQEKLAQLETWDLEHQHRAALILKTLTADRPVMRELAMVRAELKQTKDSLACHDQKLKRANVLLTIERRRTLAAEARSQRLEDKYEHAIQKLKKKRKRKPSDDTARTGLQEIKNERIRARLLKQQLKRQYQDLLARLAAFRRATSTWGQVILVGVSDVRTMCGRIKTEAQKLGKDVAGPLDER